MPGPALAAPDLPLVLDYGRGRLLEHGWCDWVPDRIEPGRFLIGTGEGFRFRVVPEGDGLYMGIALDRPQPGGHMVFGDLFYRSPINDPPEGRMGDYAFVDGRRTRIGVDRADRAFDLCAVLERLLERFWAAPQHQQTGFLADSRDKLGISWEVDESKANGVGRLVRCVAAPMNSPEVVARDGSIYASHFMMNPPPFDIQDDQDFAPNGWAGRLTLVGQMTCTWAVLQDRLAELAGSARAGAHLEAMHALVGRSKHPLAWDASENRDLARVRGELQLWRSSSDGVPEDLIDHETAAGIAENSSRTIRRWIGLGLLTPHGKHRRVSEGELRLKLPQLRRRRPPAARKPRK